MLVFLFVLIVMILIITFSKIRIEIENFRFNLPKIENKLVNDTFLCKLKLVIFGIVPIVNLKIDKAKFNKIKNNNKLKNFNIKMDTIGKTITKDSIEYAKKLHLQINKLDLSINLGAENTILTSILIPAISTFLSIALARKKVKTENQKFEITPIYNRGNLVNIVFQGIFEIQMIHIIKVICIKIKKRRVEKNERTSNRRSYGYSYE